MSTELKLPNLGENVESGDVVTVLVSVGDTIAEQQPVLELETDKAIVEVPSAEAGVVEKIHVKAGEKIAVGQPILTLATDGGTKAETATEEVDEKEKPEPPAEKKKPKPPKKEPERESMARGLAETYDAARRPKEPVVTPTETTQAIPASPSVRRLAREIGVDIYQVTGSGPQGRISVEDVKAYSKHLHEVKVEAPAAPAAVGIALPEFSRWGEIEKVPFSNVRRKTAEHMTRSWTTIPHVTQHDECDIAGLEKLRKQYARKVEAAGGKLTVTAIALKFVAAALKVFPQVNASIDTVQEEVILKKYIHIGVAVDTPRGLLVPVVRDVDQKNIIQLSVELKELAEKARNGKLSLDEMQGGTFTITNLGGIGGTSFTPIVNWPEVAILGMSRAKVRPIYRDGSVVPGTFLPLSLSYDHRLIDGADAARFLRWLAQALEEPFIVSLEG
jgi:pyruvate dehydrogenase E2 component (dihydrolipoamide acetyltransferase)